MNLNDRGVLLRNNKGNENNWLMIRLIGSKSNRDGIGARIKITVGDKVQAAQKKSTTGYLSQNDPRLHFGLGSNKKADLIEIIWPSEIVQKFKDVEANQVFVIKESSQN